MVNWEAKYSYLTSQKCTQQWSVWRFSVIKILSKNLFGSMTERDREGERDEKEEEWKEMKSCLWFEWCSFWHHSSIIVFVFMARKTQKKLIGMWPKLVPRASFSLYCTEKNGQANEHVKYAIFVSFWWNSRLCKNVVLFDEKRGQFHCT